MDFENLISNPIKVKELLEGSCVSGFNYQDWKKGRGPILEFIDKPGTILDVGCANGFLLKCLQNWCKFKLDVYGLDPVEKYISDAKKLFPEFENHFIISFLDDLDILPDNFPLVFDFIYWSVWDGMLFDTEKGTYLLETALRRVEHGGKLILGFYHKQMQKNLVKIDQIKMLGYEVDKIIEAGTGSDEIFISILKN